MITWRGGLRIRGVAAIGVTLCALTLTIPASATSSGGVKIAAVSSVLCPGPTYPSDGNPVGVPAIQPRNDCMPSFTVQDALDYVRANPFPNKGILPVGTLAVTKVAFISVHELSSVLRLDSMGLPNDAIVCYVEEYGTVLFTALATDHRSHVVTVYQIFDGRSGNLLESVG